MSINFKTLCEHLSLSQRYSSQEQLNALTHWCEETISPDCQYPGSEYERYDQYMAAAEDYLDHFLPKIPDKLLEPVVDFHDMNTIQYAAWNGYERFLSSRPVTDPEWLNTGNIAGMTPLHLAALRGHVHTVKTLLALGALPAIADRMNQYPLHSALVLPMLYDDAMKERKIDIFHAIQARAPESLLAIDSNGETIAHAMASNGFDGLTRELIQKNVDLVFHANNSRKYPIHVAILNAQLAVVKALLEVEGMHQVCDAENRSALHYAAKYGDARMMAACCERHPDLDRRDGSDKSALLLAAEAGNLPALKVLVNQGADLLLKDYQDKGLLHYAEQSHNTEMLSWILENTPLHPDGQENEGRTFSR